MAINSSISESAGASTADWLIPSLIDFRAQTEPDTIFALYPAARDSYAEGFRSVSYAALANAINGAAHWLERTLGKPEHNKVLAYVGTNDLRFNIFLAAAIKVGYTLLLLSPRNSSAAQQNLLELTECATLLTTSPTPPASQMIARVSPSIEIHHVPELADLLDTKATAYPFSKTFAENKTDRILILHASGSTGLPKPITHTHEFPAAWQHMMQLPTPTGSYCVWDVVHGKRMFSMLPPFHIAGVAVNFTSAVFNKTTVILPLGTRPPSAQDVLEVLAHVEVDVLFGSPLTCRELVDGPGLLDAVASKIEYMFFSGGACPVRVGNIITQKMKFFSVVGSSEAAGYCQIRRFGEWARDEWNWAEFHPRWNIEMRQFDGDLHECFFVRNKEAGDAQTLFAVFPHLQEWSSKDLYVPHPTKPRLWSHRGRMDDIIVFLNGEKTNPIAFEAKVTSHPEIDAALVVGAQRFQAALLVEPRIALEGPSARAAFLESIWPLIEKANAECPAHARVARSHVLFTDVTPMLRAGKGTVQRQLTLELFKDRIEQLYVDGGVQEAKTLPDLTSPTMLSHDALLSVIRQSALYATQWKQLGVRDDFFTSGMDSLQVLQLTRSIKTVLECPDLAPSVIYTHSTIEKLATAIVALEHTAKLSEAQLRSLHHQQIDSSFNHYAELIDGAAKQANSAGKGEGRHQSERVVLLTGSTGTIGSFLLRELLKMPVTHIYCLGRGTDLASLQARRNESRGLDYSWDPSRVTHLTSSLSRLQFGLDDDVFTKMVSTVTDIIHAAWPVNFNLPLASFDHQLGEVVNLIQFASSAARTPKIVFLSSVSAIRGRAEVGNGVDVAVHEKIFSNPSVADLTGYGASKHVAERLLAYGSETLNVPSSILRIGQIAGSSNADISHETWARQQWLPSLIISSMSLVFVPDSLSGSKDGQSLGDQIDWIPVDVLASVIVELIDLGQSRTSAISSKEAAVFHVVNPKKTDWRTLLPAIRDFVLAQGGKPLETVPLEVWVEKVKEIRRKVTETPDAVESLVEKVPAIRLLEFYERLLTTAGATQGAASKIETTNAERASLSLRDLEAVSAEQMGFWTASWVGST